MEDFFHHDPGLRGCFAKAFEILLRVPETVRMIDPHAVKHTLPQPFDDKAVRVLKDFIVFHPHAYEGVDVEKAPVAQVTLS